jgi:hypothetical protein
MSNQTPIPDFLLHNRSFFKLPNAAPSLFKILAQCGIAPAATVNCFPSPPQKNNVREKSIASPLGRLLSLPKIDVRFFFKKEISDIEAWKH